MSDRDLGNRLYHANRALDIVIDEDAGHPEDAADYRTVCDGEDTCANLIDVDTAEAQDGMCVTCWSNSHFDCESCGEEFHNDERSETHRRMCEECGCEACIEERDALCDEINELMGALDGDADEMAKLKKIRAYVKKLSK